MKISVIKYANNDSNIKKFGDPLLNIGNDKYIIVNAKTKELNVGFPYLAYCIDVQTVPSSMVGSLPLDE